MARNWRNMNPRTVALVMALGVALLWGFREYSNRRAMEIQAENQYQRAFQDLAFHLDSLETELGKALVATSSRQRVRSFSDIWRHAYSAQANLGQLPLAPVPLARTETFLGRVGAFTYTLAQKDSEGVPPSDRELRTLRELGRQARFVSDSVARLRDDLDRRGVRWNRIGRSINATSTIRPEKEPVSSVDPASKGLKLVEDGMKRFPEPDFSGTLPPEKVKPRAIVGATIGPDDAVRIARQFLGPGLTSGMTVRVVSTISTQPAAYRVEVRPARGLPTRIITLDVSRVGGHILWMIDDRAPGVTKLTMDEATALGLKFLESKGYRNMTPVFREKVDNIALITYAYVEDGVIIYPDQVRLRIALDNGTILGFEAISYLTFHHTRTLPAPRVSPEDLEAKFSPEVEVIKVRPVVIMDDLGNEKLCYEFTIRLDGETYLSYIDAVTAQEHRVQRITRKGTEVI
ncbi:MAG TPA: germination protein YpeB [Firmicutes bacterium]|nr:germination protein YpeB [Bacillota bacterium]